MSDCDGTLDQVHRPMHKIQPRSRSCKIPWALSSEKLSTTPLVNAITHLNDYSTIFWRGSSRILARRKIGIFTYLFGSLDFWGDGYQEVGWEYANKLFGGWCLFGQKKPKYWLLQVNMRQKTGEN